MEVLIRVKIDRVSLHGKHARAEVALEAARVSNDVAVTDSKMKVVPSL